MNEFLQRLKERKLVQWTVAYVAAAFALLQGVDIVAQRFAWPDFIERALIIAACIGFFLVLVLAWYHGERGAQKVSGTELLIVGLILALGGGFLWRFGSIAEVAKEKPISLPNETRATVAVSIPEKSIAVLPFENLSADKDNAFFASGIQDMILTKLAGIKDLKVISRTSTEKYASHPENLKHIGQELGVAKLLEGSVQKAGNSVLINVQMIDATTDAHLWADAYTRTLDNIFGVEGEVAEKIAESLHAALTGNERAALAQKPTENAAALEAYLKGLSLVGDYSVSPESSVAAFQEAVTLDPSFTLAWIALASGQLDVFWFAYDATPGRLAAAKAALDKAEALAPDLPEVEMTRAEYLYHGLYDFTGALEAIRKIQPRLPNNAHLWYVTALLERRLGQFDAALQHFAHARELDPNNLQIAADADTTLLFLGQTAQARAALNNDLVRHAQDPLFCELILILDWNTGGLDAADEFLASLTSNDVGVVAMRAWQAFYRRDFKKAADLFSQASVMGAESHSQLIFDSYIPAKTGWLLRQALSETRSGSPAKAKVIYLRVQEMARAGLTAKSGSRNVDAAWHAALGTANAGLGETEEAVAEGKAATALVPFTVDHWEGQDWEAFLAQIYAMNGNAERAVPLLQRPTDATASAATPAMLRLDPIWDPIRKDPRFQILLAKQPAEQ